MWSYRASQTVPHLILQFFMSTNLLEVNRNNKTSDKGEAQPSYATKSRAFFLKTFIFSSSSYSMLKDRGRHESTWTHDTLWALTSSQYSIGWGGGGLFPHYPRIVTTTRCNGLNCWSFWQKFLDRRFTISDIGLTFGWSLETPLVWSGQLLFINLPLNLFADGNDMRHKSWPMWKDILTGMLRPCCQLHSD